MRRIRIASTVLAVALASLASTARAQQPQAQCRAAWNGYAWVQSCPTASTATYAAPSYGSPQAALQVLNAARAAAGRPPLPFDPNLAAWASRNVANPASPHNVMAPGAGQCTDFQGDPVAAAHRWLNSPPHRAIIMNANASIGISPSPGGVTLNAR